MKTRTKYVLALIGVLVILPFVGDKEFDTSRIAVIPHPSYTIVDEWDIPNGGFGKEILIPSTLTNEHSLRILGESLKNDTKDDRNAIIDVYNNPRAASMYKDGIVGDLSEVNQKFFDLHHVAIYNKNSNTGNNEFIIMLQGTSGKSIHIGEN